MTNLTKRSVGPATSTNQPLPAKVVYCLYARKSSESDELQALSIESQIAEMTKIAQRDGLEVAEIRKESHSAKATGQREVFNGLLEDIKKGRFNSILTWAPDPVRAPIIRQMFEKVGNEGWPGRKVHAWLRHEVKFRTVTGKSLSLGNIYMLLKKTFYYGVFEYPVGSGNWYTGQHTPIITKELYDRVQEQLVRSEINKENKEFAFTRLITCGACGSGVTVAEKYKHQDNGNVHRYVYYRCTRSKNPDCKEGYIKEEEIIEQITKILDTLDVNELGVRHKFKDEITRYNKFRRIALGKSREKSPEPEEFDAKAYAIYLLTEGTIGEKRELLSNLKSRLMLKGRAITLMSVSQE